jgi:hypothetical protein
MINTILIVLVAVVGLIVIIAFLALHFLRADDSDTFDEISEEPRRTRRSPADPPRELVPVAAERGRPRRPEPARDSWPAERPVRAADDRPAGYRDRDTGPRPAAPDRRNGQTGGQRPVAAGARSAKPAKPAKPADPDPKSGSWESLSDVDYWAELAADKPQVTPAAAPGPARPSGAARRGADAKPGTRMPANARAMQPDARTVQRGESGPLPVRSRSQPSRTAPPASEPATQGLAALARLSGQPPAPAPRPAGGPRPGNGQRPAAPRLGGGQRSGTGQRPAQPPLSGLPSAPISQANGHSRPPVPLDDDPLTSPSFPAINTSDSRSYRTRPPGGAPSGPHTGPHTGPQQLNGRGGGFGEPTAQYPATPAAAPAPIPRGPVTQPPAPVANPYGSYVSAPQPTYQGIAASAPDAPSYGGGYSSAHQADGSWYGGAPNGYLPAAGYPGADHPGNDHVANGHNGNGHNGYLPADYPSVSYQGAGYQAAPAAPTGYEPQGQFDQRGYSSPDLAYGQDGYQGYTGYGPGGR